MQELLTAWHKGEKDFMSSKTAHFNNNIFYSYGTKIAGKCKNVIWLNTNTYSRTTSSQQKAIRDFARYNNYKLIEVSFEQELNWLI